MSGEDAGEGAASAVPMRKPPFLLDVTAPWMMSPLKLGAAARQPLAAADKDSDAGGSGRLYAVQTWFMVSYWHSLDFSRMTVPVIKELEHAPGLVAWTVGNKLTLRGVVFETLTVWERPEDMGAFYRGPSHQAGRASAIKSILPDDREFGIRRMWLTRADLPAIGDYFATRAFFTKVKSNSFELAPSPGPASPSQ